MGDDLVDDMYEMNDLSEAIVGVPMGWGIRSSSGHCR
jgi:hypothetical protein